MKVAITIALVVLASFLAELPEEPSEAQLEAWIELAALLADAGFAARVREMAVASAGGQRQPIDITQTSVSSIVGSSWAFSTIARRFLRLRAPVHG